MITPRNEIETIILFVQLCANIPDIDIISFDATYPDAMILWKDNKYRAEFEFMSYNFHTHRHDPKHCDIIICWEDNYPNSILPVIALSNPDWHKTEIIITKNSEKMATYWKRRALEAEEKLDLFRLDSVQEQSYIEELEDFIKPPSAHKLKMLNRQSRVREMLESGASDYQIAQEIYGHEKLAGSAYYEVSKVRNELSK